MRIRAKPFARGELAACEFFVSRPELFRNSWSQLFESPEQPLFLELGCGKGNFAVQYALDNPEHNLIAIDIKNEVLVVGKRLAEREFAKQGKSVLNLRFTALDIERILLDFGVCDRLDGIFVNFCNPWPKPMHHKRRLTHPRQLKSYASLLKPNGFLQFRTDDKQLYNASLEYFEQCGWDVTDCCEDIYALKPRLAKYPTEHQLQFAEKGQPIYYALARAPKAL